jgi:hypothetical protein
MDSVAIDWFNVAGNTLAIGLLVGSFALIAILVLNKRTRS